MQTADLLCVEKHAAIGMVQLTEMDKSDKRLVAFCVDRTRDLMNTGRREAPGSIAGDRSRWTDETSVRDSGHGRTERGAAALR